MLKALAVATAILLGSWSQLAQAAPITYLGTLQSGVPVSDSVPLGNLNLTLADYWQFTLTEETGVTITGHRIDGGLDPAFYLYRGLWTDTTQLGSPLAFADDELAPAVAGPWGDPFLNRELPEGDYTVAFLSFLSAGPGPFAYCLELNGPADSCGDRQVPMPATLLLLGLGAIGIGALQYGRFRRHMGA